MFTFDSKSNTNMYTFTMQVPDYLAQWATHHLGNPVEFPKDSPESRLIKLFIDKQPRNRLPDLRGNLAIKIPSSKAKDPRAGYFYMSPRAQTIIKECLSALFIQNLWAELSDINKVNCELSTAIYAWLEKHGIADTYWECVRQKYYRLRKLYEDKGIKLKDY